MIDTTNCQIITSTVVEVNINELELRTSVDRVCDNQSIQFNLNTSLPTLTEFDYKIAWEFYDDFSLADSFLIWEKNCNNLNPCKQVDNFFLPGVKYYTLNIQEEKNKICIKPDTQRFIVLPTTTISPQRPYDTSIEDSLKSWTTIRTNLYQTSSWNLKKLPFDSTINITDTSSYFIIDTIQGNEKSYLISPCIMMDSLFDRAMIRLKYLNSLKEQRNGIVLQASLDEAQSWILIGRIGTGNNWYNSFPIDGNPGDQDTKFIGWSGDSDEVLLASHQLDSLLKHPAYNGTVIFRFAFGGAESPPDAKELFAVKDIEILNRKRKILVEYFTNLDYWLQLRDFLYKIAEEKQIDIEFVQIHTDIARDIIFEHSADASKIRTFHYGLNEIDYSLDFPSNDQNAIRIGGEVIEFCPDDPTSFSAIECAIENTINLKSLEDPDFEISDVELVKSGDTVERIKVKLKAQELISSEKEFLLHVYLVANEVDSALQEQISPDPSEKLRNVMMAMLPDPAGNFIKQRFHVGDSLEFTIPENDNLNLNSLPHFAKDSVDIVVFVQEIRRSLTAHPGRIHQVTRIKTPIKLPYDGVIRRNPNPNLSRINNLEVFPNPIRNHVNISFEVENISEWEWQIFDMLGRRVINRQSIPDNGEWKIDLNFLKQGYYHFVFFHKTGKIITRKIQKL